MERSAPVGPPHRRKSKQQCAHDDAGLLFCCMEMLQIDRARLMRDEPLLYRELQGVCTLCPNRQECSIDLPPASLMPPTGKSGGCIARIQRC